MEQRYGVTKKTVSVIVPFYNAEKYLEKCMTCILCQTLKNMEIILVNDASTDHSLGIAKVYQQKYPDRVILIDSQVNQGAGGARNLGVAVATGEYIGFVDSDDLLEPTMYEKLYLKALQKNYDIVDCGYYNQENDSAIIHTADELTGILDDKKRSALIVSGGYIVSKIFHRRLFEQDGWQFRKHVILEDSDFMTYFFATAESIGNVKEVLYYYRYIEDSSSKVMDTARYYHNICEAIKAIHKRVSGLHNYAAIQQAVEYEMIQMYSYGINICARELLQKELVVENLKRLDKIAEIRRHCITEGYDNPYVKAKIDVHDIMFMQWNDLGSEEFYKRIQAVIG